MARRKSPDNTWQGRPHHFHGRGRKRCDVCPFLLLFSLSPTFDVDVSNMPVFSEVQDIVLGAMGEKNMTWTSTEAFGGIHDDNDSEQSTLHQVWQSPLIKLLLRIMKNWIEYVKMIDRLINHHICSDHEKGVWAQEKKERIDHIRAVHWLNWERVSRWDWSQCISNVNKNLHINRHCGSFWKRSFEPYFNNRSSSQSSRRVQAAGEAVHHHYPADHARHGKKDARVIF